MPTIIELDAPTGESESSDQISPVAIAASLDRATTTILRIGFAIGLASAAVLIPPPLLAGEPFAIAALNFAWCVPWLAAALVPRRAGEWLSRALWPIVATSAMLLALTVNLTGGFDSYLKTAINWLPWVIAALFPARKVAASAAIVSTAIAVGMISATGFAETFSPENRYTAVTDLLNPWLVAVIAMSLAGIFRVSFQEVGSSIGRFRAGDWSPSGLRLPTVSAMHVLDEDNLPVAAQSSKLTPAEAEVVDFLAVGLTPKQIAHQTRRSLDTVYEHIANAKLKTGTSSIAHLVTFAWRAA